MPQCFDSLKWCDDVVVVDSFSTDATLEICKNHSVDVYQNRFLGFGSQRNWAIDNISLKHDWILVLDADERVPDELAEELNQIAKDAAEDIGAARMRRRFYMWGRWLRYSSLYPSWVVRFVHKDRVRYSDRGHSESQQVKGEIIETKHDLIDENIKGIDEWFSRQNRYARAEAEFELAEEQIRISFSDVFAGDPMTRRKALKRIASRVPFRPTLFFLYNYIFKFGFRDGKDGLMFCFMKASYERMITIKKYDARKHAKSKS